MPDYHDEVPLEPGVPRIIIYYPVTDGSGLVVLRWSVGEDHYTWQCRDEEPENRMMRNPDNPYLATVEMVNDLDLWIDENDDMEVNVDDS